MKISRKNRMEPATVCSGPLPAPLNPEDAAFRGTETEFQAWCVQHGYTRRPVGPAGCIGERPAGEVRPEPPPLPPGPPDGVAYTGPSFAEETERAMELTTLGGQLRALRAAIKNLGAAITREFKEDPWMFVPKIFMATFFAGMMILMVVSLGEQYAQYAEKAETTVEAAKQ